MVYVIKIDGKNEGFVNSVEKAWSWVIQEANHMAKVHNMEIIKGYTNNRVDIGYNSTFIRNTRIYHTVSYEDVSKIPMNLDIPEAPTFGEQKETKVSTKKLKSKHTKLANAFYYETNKYKTEKDALSKIESHNLERLESLKDKKNIDQQYIDNFIQLKGKVQN